MNKFIHMVLSHEHFLLLYKIAEVGKVNILYDLNCINFIINCDSKIFKVSSLIITYINIYDS